MNSSNIHMYNCMLIDVFQFLNMKKIAEGRLSEKGLDQMFTVQINKDIKT